MPGYLAKMEEQGFEELNMLHDAQTGLKAVIAIHSTVRGPALGGTRMWTYPTEEAAIDDVLCLARGMSYKAAAAELPVGGGKGVIIGDPERDKCEELFRCYGRCVERLNGRFMTGKDMGIDEQDLDCMCRETKHVVGGSEIGSPSPFTAYGVWKGIKACAEEVFGSPDLEGKVVAVQGVGSVGIALCRFLAGDGARLIVSDLDEKRVKQAVDDWDAEAVDPRQIYTRQCDIFSPCGAGGVVNAETLPGLKCRIIAGAANNIIKESHLGTALKERGILYAPDYVINAGGLIFVELNRQGTKDAEKIKAEVARIEGRLKELFRRAREQDLLPSEMADIIAEEKLQKKLKV